MITFAEFLSLLQARQIFSSANEYDEELLRKAFELGQKAHTGQIRASGEPYFDAHSVPVALHVAELGMSDAMIAAALLHDVIEDTAITKEVIEETCGSDIALLVDGVSKLSKVKFRGNERHVESLRKFFVAIAQDVRVVIIKLCDRWHNLETLHHLPEEKRKRIALESIHIHAPLASRLGMGKLKVTISDLAFPHAFPEQYQKTLDVMKPAMTNAQATINQMYTEIPKLMDSSVGYVPDIDKRIKGTYSLYKKLERKDWDITQIFDLIALRIIVKDVSDCYRALGAIHANWPPLPGRLKDYIAVPKPNGYKSLHTAVMSRSGVMVEIQIRTHAMHAYNEFGVASHHTYKSRQTGEQRESFEWLSQLSSLKSDQLTPDEYIHELQSDFFSDRIFALTPLGDVIDLPVGATILDFAYALHSDIGDSAIGGRIDGTYKGLDTPVPSESVVEIVTAPKTKPSEKWLEWTITNHAHTKIKKAIRARRG